ncbi:MAG: DUF1489 domain-containing protein [Rhodospirillales bacterium]|nr:DUF1489 domain-containing protein [Rhodospirillales bacterium]
MSVNLLRMAVGIESTGHLRRRQSERLEAYRREHGEAVLRTFTRNVPRRAGELIDGGSIYWVIKRFIRVRQRILGVDEFRNDEGKRRCFITLDPELTPVEMRAQKPFQGWRYLRPEDSPPDVRISREQSGELPPEMAADLRELGLI